MSSSGSNFLGGNWNGKTDPIGNAIASYGGGQLDPLNLYAVNQPGGANYIAKNGTPAPGSLTPLSPSSTIPFAPNGAFMPIQPQQGIFNQMAANSAGQLFNPAAQNPANGAKGPQNTPATNVKPTPFNGNVSYGGGLNRGYLKP